MTKEVGGPEIGAEEGALQQMKWVGRPGTVDPGTVDPRRLGKRKHYEVVIEITVEQGTLDWLNQNAKQRDNEPGGRWGIPADKIDEFNAKVYEITTRKR